MAWLRAASRVSKRSALLKRTSAVLAIASAVPLMLFVTVSSLALSPEQRAQRDIGRLGAAMDVSTFFDTDARDVELLAEDVAKVRAGTGEEILLQLRSFDVRGRSNDRVTYLETDWSRHPYPERYRLTSGQWPRVSGEVVLAENLPTDVPAVFDVLSGNESLIVTGVVEDRFASSGRTILAAPGTWSSFDWSLLSTRFPNVSVQPTILYDVDAASTTENMILREVISPRSSQPIPANLLEIAIVTQDEILGTERADLFSAVPALLPLVVWSMPVLGMSVLAGAGGVLLHRRVDTLRAVGLSTRRASVIMASATLFVGLVSTIVGLLAGGASALLARPLLDQLLEQPLSPLPSIWPVVAQELVGVLLVGAVIWLVFVSGPSGTPAAARRIRFPPAAQNTAALVRRGLGDAALVIAIFILAWQVITADTDTAAFASLGGALLVALFVLPELVKIAVGILPQSGPRWRLTSRKLITDQSRIVTGAALISCFIAPTATIMMFTHMSQITDLPQQMSLVPEGQLEIIGDAPDSLLALARSELPEGTRSLTTHSLYSDSQIVTMKSDGLGAVLVVDSAKDLEALNGGPLPGSVTGTLEAGGVLLTASDAGGEAVFLYATDTRTGEVTPIGPLSTASASLNPSWAFRFPSAILTSTASSLSLPSTPKSTVFTGLSPDLVAQVRERVVANGYDPAMAQSYDPQDPFPVPLSVIVASASLLIALFIVTLWLSRSHAAALRPYSAALLAMGLPPSWSRVIAARQGLLVLLLGLSVGGAVAAVPVTLATQGPAGLVFAVPWLWLAVVAAAVALATVLGIGLGVRGVSELERGT